MARGKRKLHKSSRSEHKRRQEKKNVKVSSKREASHMRQTHVESNDKFNKRRKIEEIKPSIDDTVDSSSDDEVDNFKQLLSTFITQESRSKTVSIESDDSENDEDSECIELTNITHDTLQNSRDDSTMLHKVIKRSEDECDRPWTIENYDEKQECIDDSFDPFVSHFHYDLDESLLEAVSVVPPVFHTHEEQWPILGRILFNFPKVLDGSDKLKINKLDVISKTKIEEVKRFAKPGTVPVQNGDLSKLYIKSQIHGNIAKANSSHFIETQENSDIIFTPLQKELFSIINNYQDLYFPMRTLKNGEEVRFAYCLHAVNHILKTRTKILHHNAKLSKRQEIPDDFRDQGLVRPKVLILVPFRDSALRVVKMIISILLPDEKANVINKSRFLEEFTGDEIAMPRRNPRPEDYEVTFAGNTDDTFRIGMAITNKSLKLYTDFYSSDILVASPLGLRVIVGADGENERDFDFLASIELLVLDQAEIFLMQNWDHLLHVLDHLHLQPREAHGTDFARVRSWGINGWAHFYRQTLLLSSVTLPEINALFNKKCTNYAGKARIVNQIPTGSVCQVVVQLPQVFQKLDVEQPSKAIDNRFEFFKKKMLPQYKDSIMNHTLIYIPSYFDYVRVRNYFKEEELSFVQICEYSKDPKIARARDMFFHSDAHFLLYSERFHFFRRLRIKGIRHIIFYQPPTFPQFYSEMCNLMQEANQSRYGGTESNMTVTVAYSKYDAQQLAGIVGTDRAGRMLASERNTHMFMTGE